LGIDQAGNLWGWGDNANGEVGNGTSTEVATPEKINLGNVLP
jgi:alpha-tubulin suppressor-like RCC1 family protein